MCADTKTLSVDRVEVVGKPGGSRCLSQSISAKVLQHSAGKEQKGVKKERVGLLIKAKENTAERTAKPLGYSRISISTIDLVRSTSSRQVYLLQGQTVTTCFVGVQTLIT